MLLTVNELGDRVSSDLGSLISELSELTGRGGSSELNAWRKSLPRLVDALTDPALAEMHVHFARRAHHVDLEYQLPGASAWCDVVLLGRNRIGPSAVVVELKDWETMSDRPGMAEGLIERHGVQELHPSDQVRGYVEYCRRFHSAVLERKARVDGLVLFTTGLLKHPYVVPPNKNLVEEFPIFTMASEDIGATLPRYLTGRLEEPDAAFATEFASGSYRQDRGFMQQIGGTILDGDIKHFELLDNQRRALNLCLATAKDALGTKDGRKKIIVIEGPPGSGKSAVAARLWAHLVRDPELPDGNVVLVTTSQSQSSNLTYLIDEAARTRVGRGVARKATSFSPLDIPGLKRLRGETGIEDLYRDASKWREHLADLERRRIPVRRGAEDDGCLVSIVDEAHALINPEREHGVGQYGFVTGLGPQAYHIIRASQVTVFLLDPSQSFRARENTTIDDIRSWAHQLGAKANQLGVPIDQVSLHGVQFRCAGSAEYVAWVEAFLSGGSEDLCRVYASAWLPAIADGVGTRDVVRSGNVIAFPARSGAVSESGDVLAVSDSTGRYTVRSREAGRPHMDFRIFADPFEMERALRSRASNATVRLISTYSRPWKTEGSTYPHRLPAEAMDFCEVIECSDGQKRTWSRPWNFVPRGTDYTGFVAGRPGLPIHDDPLCEVGCTYAVRGFDFDYLGLLWLDDLLWRDGRWMVQLDNVHETGIGTLVRQARTEGSLAPAGPRGVNVVEKVRQAYRILLTRAIKGMYVWIPDEETRTHAQRSLVAAT